MALSTDLFIALRYVFSRHSEGFISFISILSFLGIMLGVATLIIVMSVMNGFRQELLSRILDFNGHISLLSSEKKYIAQFEEILTKVQNIENIVTATPLIERQVMITANDMSLGAVAYGIQLKDLAERRLIKENIKFGSLENFMAEDSIVIGKRMAEKLLVFPGQSITLISPQGTNTAFGFVPRLKTFRVVAIFEVGMAEYDSAVVFIPLSMAQKYFNFPEGAVSLISLLTKNPEETDKTIHALQPLLEGPVTILDWKQVNSSFFGAIQVERNVMFLILTLMIVVAALNIISSMVMLVKDKTAGIAILRTIGMTRGRVMRVFIIIGSSIGLVGSVLGTSLGLLFAYHIEVIRRWLEKLIGTELFSAEVYFLSKLPAIVDPLEVGVIAIMALGLSFLATVYPSWRASTIEPIKALRYE